MTLVKICTLSMSQRTFMYELPVSLGMCCITGCSICKVLVPGCPCTACLPYLRRASCLYLPKKGCLPNEEAALQEVQ